MSVRQQRYRTQIYPRGRLQNVRSCNKYGNRSAFVVPPWAGNSPRTTCGRPAASVPAMGRQDERVCPDEVPQCELVNNHARAEPAHPPRKKLARLGPTQTGLVLDAAVRQHVCCPKAANLLSYIPLDHLLQKTGNSGSYAGDAASGRPYPPAGRHPQAHRPSNRPPRVDSALGGAPPSPGAAQFQHPGHTGVTPRCYFSHFPSPSSIKIPVFAIEKHENVSLAHIPGRA